jgi:FkbM family methyltransferase
VRLPRLPFALSGGKEHPGTELSRAFGRASPAEQRSLVAEALAAMPGKTRVDLIERASPPAAMDYGRHEILLRQSSRVTAGMRLRSARKEPFTVAWVEQFQPGDVFYDVGANVGAYALIAAKSSESTVLSYAFEPSAPSFLDLFHNVILNDCAESVVPLPFALWSETTLIEFSHCSLAPGSSKHTFDFATARGDLPILYRQHQPAVSMDDAVRLFGLRPPTHVKLDTEGSELEILHGAAETLSNPGWRTILIELDEPGRARQIEDVVSAHGFGLAERCVYDRGETSMVYHLYSR